jgi:flagellin-like hook-associated protein FlgL
MKPRVGWSGILMVVLALNAISPAQKATTSIKRPTRTTALSATQQDVQALRDLVQAQQKQIEVQGQQVQQLQDQLRQVLDTVQQANANSQKLQSDADQAQAAATQAQQFANDAKETATKASDAAASAASTTALLQKDGKEQQSKLKSLADFTGRFRFTGDVRVRAENYTQTGIQDRNRARIRVRLGLEGQLNQDFIGGVALATGSLGDPTTTNETLTNAFDRKTIALDKGYITFNPVAAKWFSATGGKFAYLWQRTSVTGDPDLNPEGFDQKISFDFKHGFIKNFTVQALELLYGESSTGQDSYVLGAQAQATFAAGPWTATASFLNQHWNRPDALLAASAFATQATTTGSGTTSFPVPGEGPGCSAVGNLPKFAPCAFAANGMTNATYLDAAGKPHFASGFDIANFILNNQIKTGAARFPINLVLEFEDNLDAAAHPLDVSGNPILNLGSQNKEYGVDFGIGQTKARNDFQVGYSWYRQEQDSVLSSIAESDQRAPTNILQNKVYGNWKVRSNTTASVTWWYGRVLNTFLENNAALYNNWGGGVSNAFVSGKSTISAPGLQEPWLSRLQFDLMYTY